MQGRGGSPVKSLHRAAMVVKYREGTHRVFVNQSLDVRVLVENCITASCYRKANSSINLVVFWAVDSFSEGPTPSILLRSQS